MTTIANPGGSLFNPVNDKRDTVVALPQSCENLLSGPDPVTRPEKSHGSYQSVSMKRMLFHLVGLYERAAWIRRRLLKDHRFATTASADLSQHFTISSPVSGVMPRGSICCGQLRAEPNIPANPVRHFR